MSKITTRARFALRFALQLSEERAESLRRLGEVTESTANSFEAFFGPANIARMAVERADALCKALETTPDWRIQAAMESESVPGRRKTNPKSPAKAKRVREVHPMKGKARQSVGRRIREASDWLEANHDRGATMDDAAEAFGVKLGTLKTYRTRWIEQGTARPLPGGARPNPIAADANAFYEAGGVTIKEAAERFGISERTLQKFRTNQLGKLG